MTFLIVELVLSLAAILGAAVVFTNAIEILGERLNLGQGAVGSVLAAVGTALPETMIPVIAIVGALVTTGSAGSSQEIGVGAILGAPFLLATLAMFVVGASVLGFRGRRESGTRVTIEESVTRRDITYFLVFFTLAAGVGLAGSFVAVPFFLKVIVAVVLVGAYAFYVRQTLKSGGSSQEGETPEDLMLWPESSWGDAPIWIVVAQVLGSVVVMGVGAHFFVTAVEEVSGTIGVPAGLISLVLAPLATELPEKFNSIIWVRQDKDTLAFGNVSGAMVFQSTIPVSLGLVFTAWSLDFITGFAAVLTVVAGVILFLLLLRRAHIRALHLVGLGVFYAVFLAVAIYTIAA